MKKIKFNKKFQLNKETIANLNAIKGGENDVNSGLSLWSCDPSNKPKSCCNTQCEGGNCVSFTRCDVSCAIQCIR